MLISRRRFTHQLTLLSAASLASSSLLAAAKTGAPSSQDIILGGGQYRHQNGDHMRYLLAIIRLSSQQHYLADMPFLPHGIHPHPKDPRRLAIFEKKGSGACEYDLT